jgi:hypothetical protein
VSKQQARLEKGAACIARHDVSMRQYTVVDKQRFSVRDVTKRWKQVEDARMLVQSNCSRVIACEH